MRQDGKKSCTRPDWALQSKSDGSCAAGASGGRSCCSPRSFTTTNPLPVGGPYSTGSTAGQRSAQYIAHPRRRRLPHHPYADRNTLFLPVPLRTPTLAHTTPHHPLTTLHLRPCNTQRFTAAVALEIIWRADIVGVAHTAGLAGERRAHCTETPRPNQTSAATTIIKETGACLIG